MKQNYKSVILLLMFSFISYNSYSEPLKKTGLDEAEEAYAQNNLTQAEALYLQVLAKTPDHYLSNARLGSLYLGMNQPGKSIGYLKKALEMHKGYSLELNQQLSIAYQLSAHFDNAITLYYDLLKRGKKNSRQVRVYQKKINECISGKQLMATPLKVKVSNLGPLVNSAKVDHVPVLTASDNTILFASQRSKDIKKPTAASDEDIYLINREEKGWSSPTRLSKPFNTAQHEAILAVTAEGNKMYLYSNKDNKGDIYESRKENNNAWQSPVKLGANINTRYHELSFVVSVDGSVAFFSSNRPGGYGGLDLYMSIADGTGKWGEAINLGPNVNTSFDEDAPFLSSDNNILYFSSRGHNAMGGYDIFKSSINGSVWSVAQNLGVPINSPYDDAFYVLTQDGKTAYFSSNRPGGLGESDIYTVETEEDIALEEVTEYEGFYTAMLGANQMESIMQTANTIKAPAGKQSLKVKGYIIDALTKDTLNGRLTLLDKTLYTTESVLETNAGYFEFDLESDKSYGLLIESAGYKFSSCTLSIPEDASKGEIDFRAVLYQDTLVSPLALQNIQFYPNHDYIKSSSLAELEWLYTYLLDNPQVNVVITDYQNEEDTMQYKKKLNQQRANSVIKYLGAKGLESGRIRFQGKTKEQVTANNASANGMILQLEQND
ncbi:MAG: hypothetical protein JWQ14_1594 [Adhaeribacter sp.]|nr:hypothetical protein [Adhaeribacter sp.]